MNHAAASENLKSKPQQQYEKGESSSSSSSNGTKERRRRLSTTTTASPCSGQSLSDRRLVLFAGPHKSASSSIQEFFMKYASNHPNFPKHPSLINWTWPYNIRRRSYLPRKGFAPLVTEFHDVGFVKLIHDTIWDVWTNSSTCSNSTRNLILGTEEFDRFGDTPWSHRNGIQAMQDVVTLIQPQTTQVVVNYRRPRQQQWISIWKQLTRSNPENAQYSKFLCDPNEYTRLWEYLDSVANPLGFVKALLQQNEYATNSTTASENGNNELTSRQYYWDKVVLLDMQGISDSNLDVAHVLACNVVLDGNTSCPNGWMPGLEPKEHRNMKEQQQQGQSSSVNLNQKKGDPQLTPKQLDEVEWLLRQRDCTHQMFLQDHGRFKVQHGETLWQNCPHQGNPQFSNTTLLLHLLQSHVGCGPYANDKSIISKLQQEQEIRIKKPKATTTMTTTRTDDIHQQQQQQHNKTRPLSPPTPPIEKPQPSSPVSLNSANHDSQLKTAAITTTNAEKLQLHPGASRQHHDKEDPHDSLLQVAKLQFYTLYAIFLFISSGLCWLQRRRRGRRRTPQKHLKDNNMTSTNSTMPVSIATTPRSIVRRATTQLVPDIENDNNNNNNPWNHHIPPSFTPTSNNHGKTHCRSE